ncbi:MAG TPA: hypothetical protein VFW94_15120 [Candidatus Acidoferrales bacterium]|nr:hypothetical protein [Candidatus Acidoferrales bacterium]
MRSVYEARVAEASAIQSKLLQGTATLCSPAFGRVCKALWPRKTAENLAAQVGCSIRAAAYQISGEHEPSAKSIAAIVIAITKSN